MKKQYFQYFCLFAFTFLQMNSLFAQKHFCGADEARKKLIEKHPEILQQEVAYENEIQQRMTTSRNSRTVEQVYTIPVVFHIIHTYGTENISDAQVIDEVAILNRDFGKTNSDTSEIVFNSPFDTLATDCKIQFKLAQLDPNGNCTNGIDRIYSHKTFLADDRSKLNQWPRHKYLNIWVIATMSDPGVAGYAYYPSATSGILYPYDGIIIVHQYIGAIGTGSVGNSRALTHEVGHWLNLQHPWGNTNDPGVACGDDVVDDTPETMGHTTCDTLTPNCNSGALADLYSFANVTPTSGTIDPTAVPTDSGAYFNPFSAVGVSTNPTGTGTFEYNMWDTGAVDGASTFASLTGVINTGKYYEVTIQPWYAYSWSMTGMTFNISRTATGPRTFAVRASTTGFGTNMTATVTPANPNLNVQSGNIFYITNDTTTTNIVGARVTLPASPLYRTTPVTFRIYAWNAEDTLGSFSIDNVSFAGRAGELENTQNYMDYSYCSVMYTKGQKARMRAALESPTSLRNNLWTTTNLAETGTDGNAPFCIPSADFNANKKDICVGSSVIFTALALNHMPVSNPLNYSWSFPDGGSGSTATTATATKVYNNPGVYPVTLTIGNSLGTGAPTTKTNYIRVHANFPDHVGPTSEPFEVDNNYNYFWTPLNYDAGTGGWQLSESVGHSSSQSVKMEAYINDENDVDDLISPIYNLSGMSGMTMTFSLAGATVGTSTDEITDVLRVYRSTDCGGSWIILGTFSGANLSNNGYHPEYYVPAGSGDWVTKSITLPSAVAVPKARFKFEYTTGALSNNIYLDNINIQGTVGIDENNFDANSIAVYPNPTNMSSTVSYYLSQKADVKLELVDVLGKKILLVNQIGQSEGDHSVNISREDLGLNNGIYFIRMTVDGSTVTKKLIVTQ